MWELTGRVFGAFFDDGAPGVVLGHAQVALADPGSASTPSGTWTVTAREHRQRQVRGQENGIRAYDAELVPGLLQTLAYCRAFMRAAPAAGTDEAIERKIAVRIARQERLAADDAPEFWAVLNEAVIRRVVGGPDVMREQLDHIAAMAGRSRVSVQVLPFRAGAHRVMVGSFIVVGFPEPADPDVVYLESQTGSLYLEKLPEAERYEAMFSHLVAKALGPEESVSLIASAAADRA